MITNKFRCGVCGRVFVSRLSYLSHVNVCHCGSEVGRVNGEGVLHEVGGDDE